MQKKLQVLLTVSIVLLIALAGCGKKTTKTDTTLEPPPPIEEPTPPPPPPPEDNFNTDQMDAQLRELLQTIYFDFDSYTLKGDAISTLEKVAAFMKDNASVRVLAQGHADERGSNEYNMGLGENRAKAVRQYLTSYGISSDRIETTSYGEERPAKPDCGDDDACHSSNRRVEWQVLAK